MAKVLAQCVAFLHGCIVAGVRHGDQKSISMSMRKLEHI